MILISGDLSSPIRQVSSIFSKDDFTKYLSHISLCNLLSNKDGNLLFTPAHFDLIIVDEAHRIILKKYKTIFEYLDSSEVGLTATPKMELDRNTYDFFELENSIPTYAYDYETAVKKDKVLVPYYNIEVKTKFLEEGIEYDKLSDSDKERYEQDFSEEGELPSFIPSAKLNQYIFNQNTVDMVLQDLMENGIKINSCTIFLSYKYKHLFHIIKKVLFNIHRYV